MPLCGSELVIVRLGERQVSALRIQLYVLFNTVTAVCCYVRTFTSCYV